MSRGNYNNSFDAYYGNHSLVGPPGMRYLINFPCRVVFQDQIDQMQSPDSEAVDWMTHELPGVNVATPVEVVLGLWQRDLLQADAIAIPSGTAPQWTAERLEVIHPEHRGVPIPGASYARVLLLPLVVPPVPPPPPPPIVPTPVGTTGSGTLITVPTNPPSAGIVFFTSYSNNPVSVPSGFTLIQQVYDFNTNTSMSVFFKVSDGNTSFTVDQPSVWSCYYVNGNGNVSLFNSDADENLSISEPGFLTLGQTCVYFASLAAVADITISLDPSFFSVGTVYDGSVNLSLSCGTQVLVGGTSPSYYNSSFNMTAVYIWSLVKVVFTTPP